MKLNIELDLEDCFGEDDSNLSLADELKDNIISSVTNKIITNLNKDILNGYTRTTQQVITDYCNSDIYKKMIDDIITNDKIKKNTLVANSELITTEEYIKIKVSNMLLDDYTITTILKNIVNKKVETLSKELKDRYDILFATQIVRKLSDNNMLREDVAALLLPQTT